MKLFLASSIDKTLSKLNGLCPDAGKKVLFVPNAADPYETEHYWVDLDRVKFGELGYEIIEVDVRDIQKEKFGELLNSSDILHICGGSVSYLWWLLRDKEIDTAIIQAVKSGGVIYTGTSAGSMIVSEDLAMFSYDDDEEKEYIKRGFNKKGWGIIPWTIVPHCNQPDFVELHKRMIEELVTNPTAVILLHDNQAVWIEDDIFKFINT